MLNKKLPLLVGLMLLTVLWLAACASPEVVEVEVTRVVTETIVEAGDTVEVTRVVTEVQEVVVEVPAEQEAAGSMAAPDPSTLTFVDAGDISSMDPQLAYEGTSFDMIYNIYEGLIYPNRDESKGYVPMLAVEVPSVENGGISADGLTYTFNIRPGVQFHNGNDLTASDAAYSWARGLLQSSPNSGQWMMIEAIMGYGTGDITEMIAEGAYAGDREALIANASPEELVAVCEDVKARLVADDAAGTFTVSLERPWGPLMAIIAQPWAFVVDQDWAIENGDWDGSCDTWQNFYAPGSEDDALSYVANGTGPYILDHWTPDEEWVLTANENYWRQEGDAMWDDGPSGVATIKRIVHKTVSEWGTRFAMLQAGDAAWVTVPAANRPQAQFLVGEICDYKTGECTPTDTPDGPLRMWPNLPSTSRNDIFLNFNVKTDDQGNNPYIGSGQLDGNGIPPDFFSDLHVRKAFSYCFDYDTLISDGQNGDGTRNNGVIIAGMLGYNPDQEMYPFDLAKCEEEMAQAWDGALPDTGFRVQATTTTGDLMRMTALAILQSNLRAVNPAYQLEVVTLPSATYFSAFRAGQLPVALSSWGEDYHDPHNWVQPYLIGTFAGRQNMPDEVRDIFRPLIEQAVLESDPAKRAELYYEIGRLRHEYVPEVVLSQGGDVSFEMRWVNGYYYHPLVSSHRYIYPLSLDAGG
ncbi:MAG: ABC transporter substrate-binding protein [Chloroflexota bacterium]